MTAEPDEAGSLYELPLAEFTAARNELASRLRKQGHRAAADAVKALAKPSVSAWALNQVARRQPTLVAALLAAGQELAGAQRALLAGQGQAEFRQASQAEREAVGKVVQASAIVLTEDGHPPGKPMLDRLAATATAAAHDEERGELLRAGRLTADLDPTGFGELGGFAPPAAPIPFPKTRRGAAPKESPSSPLPQRREKEQDVRRLQQELRALRQGAGEAEGRAARARQAASKADHTWMEARHAAERAEKAAAVAHEAEQRAADELSALRQRLDSTAGALAQAEDELRQPR